MDNIEMDFDKLMFDFSKDVENIKQFNKSLTYMECIIEVCEDRNIEIEDVKKLLTKPIKDKLAAEASERNMLKYKNNTVC